MQTTENITWEGIDIQINYDTEKFGMAHLELKSDKPNPITETGYRSHFQPKEHFDLYDSIKTYVLEWLEKEAQHSKWQSYVLEKQQPTLF
jgi:hypothetical protein